MLDRILALSLRNRLFVLVGATVLSLLGLRTAANLPIDVLPDLTKPTVTLLTEAPGLVPLDCEVMVTRPLERALAGATAVTRVRSSSGPGLSVVQIEFEWGSDPYRNRQIVQEKLQLAEAELPPGVEPHMAPMASIMGQVQLIGVRSKDPKRSLSEVRALVDQRIRTRLLALPGVGQVNVIGGAPREVQVLVDAEALQAHEVGLAEVAAAVRAADVSAAGAPLPLGAQGPRVRVEGRLREISELKDAVVADRPERPVRLSDVAEVSFGPSSRRIGEAGIDGGPGVILTIAKQPGKDTVELIEAVDRELRALGASLPEDLEIRPDLFRQSEFIHRAVDNVSEAVRDGAILVVLVLLLFLLNLRTTLITLTAIPTSLALTALVFEAMGISINTMTLGGIAVAVGALVDDAIVDVENVFRRLRQNRLSASPRPALRVVFDASREVRRPILTGTAVVCIVFLPLFALSGMEGRLFAPIGVAYITSVLASLLVALTVTPVLCFYLLPKCKAVEGKDGLVVRKIQALGERMMRISLRHVGKIAALLLVLSGLGLLLLLTGGSDFLPPFNEGSAQVNLILPPGVSIDTSDRFARRLENAVAIDGIRSIARRTGRAEGDEHVEGVNASELVLAFDPDSDRRREEILGELRERIEAELPGVATEVEQPLAHLLSHLLSGVTAQVAIKIHGPDLGLLRELAHEVEGAIEGVPGVADLYVEQQVLVPTVRILPRREDLAERGISAAEVSETIGLALEGRELGRFLRDEISYPITLRLREADRRDLEALRRLWLDARDGLRLGAVAEVSVGFTPNEVKRENLLRQIVVQHNVEGRSLGEVVGDVERALSSVREALPAGYGIRIGGQFAAQSVARRTIFLLSCVALLGIFLVTSLHFRSFLLALQALASIPMAFVGAVAFIVATGQSVSIATLVGLVSLGGIATRNALLLIDHYLELLRSGQEEFTERMILRAGRERIIPVLMTALTSGIALVPLILAPGQPGREILYPVASVIVGGLVSSTLLDVLFTPGLFYVFGRKAALRAVSVRAESTPEELL